MITIEINLMKTVIETPFVIKIKMKKKKRKHILQMLMKTALVTILLEIRVKSQHQLSKSLIACKKSYIYMEM